MGRLILKCSWRRSFTVLGAMLAMILGGWAYSSSSAGATSSEPTDQATAVPPADLSRIGATGPGLRLTSTATLPLPMPRTFEMRHLQPLPFAIALERNPTRIFEFVRDQIAYEPYAGSLRGPRGTLMALAGNSVDRASLLAALLANSKQQVRFARGALPEAAARELVSSIWAERPAASPATGASLPEAKAAGEKLVAAVQRDGVLLRDALKNAGYPAPGRAPVVTLESLTKETQDHYWVQWMREGSWVDLDPSFAAATPGQTFAKVEQTFATLPDTLFHRVGFRIVVEEHADGAATRREVLQHSANAADLSGVDVLLLHQRAEEGREIRPLLVVEQDQIIGLAFSPEVNRDNANPAGGLVDALGGGGGDASLPVANAEFVELDFVGPDGRKETVVREIYDRVGKARRLSGKPVAADGATNAIDPSSDDLAASVYDFFVTTGAIHGAHVDRSAQPGPDAGVDIAAALRRMSVAFVTVSDALLTRNASRDQTRISRVYVDSPRVYVAEFSVRGQQPRLALDLRRDQARTLVFGFQPERAFYAQVARGVVQGALERAVIEFFAGAARPPGASAPPPPMSTSLLFELAQATGTPTTLLTRGKPALGPGVPEDSRARIDEALGTGDLVMALQRPVRLGNAQRFAWWRINPQLGETTAVTDEGLHQAVVESSTVRNKDGTATVTMRIRGEKYVNQQTFRNSQEAAEYVEGVRAHMAKLDDVIFLIVY
jgi:hypothetical protein